MSNRLAELKKHMLPRSNSLTGKYTALQSDKARGYRLLVHAEIESYLEDISKRAITYAIQKWKNNGKPSYVIVSFLASYHSSWNYDELTDQQIIELAKTRKNKVSVDKIIDLAQSQFIQKIKDNHGVKERNLRTLLLPIGIDIDELDQAWVIELDNFGKKRGELAHQAQRVTHAINPQDEFQTVQNLLTGLQDLDRLIQQTCFQATL